jgi:hypothetical protein
MNATITLVGALLAFAGVLATAVVAFVGKRGELALTGFNSLTDQLQEELTAKKQELRDRTTEMNVALAAAAAEMQVALAAAEAEKTVALAAAGVETARLRGIVIQLGGQP